MAKRLGEILVDSGIIDEKQLEIALAEQANTGGRLGDVLAELGFTTEHAITQALARQSGIDHVDLDRLDVQPSATSLVPESAARRLEALPLRIEEEVLVVAMANPTDIVAIDELQRLTELFVRVVSAGRRQLLRAIDRAYGAGESASADIRELIQRAIEERDDKAPEVGRGACAALVDELINLAILRDATDLHVQPDSRTLRVRFRIDGEMSAGPSIERELMASVAARIKVMAGLDISDSRLPQDGKIRFTWEKGTVDLRVSTFPSVTGESVVIRILDKGRQALQIRSLGLEPEALDLLTRTMQRPNGLILAVGPTGSGKSTTLYSLLRTVNASKRKIITLEDPVEYQVPMVTQCQVNERAGLTFANGLRSILRHDPDVVLVGEMRDYETAALAFRAALTGHLVLSTLHTNDAVRTVARLVDMGIERFIVSSCLSAVAAQRLVRKICDQCREPYAPRAEELAAVGLGPAAEGSFARGAGCERCQGTGMRGREALFEVLEVTPEVAALIARGAHQNEIEKGARAEGFVPFRAVAQRRAMRGAISLSEAARITTEF